MKRKDFLRGLGLLGAGGAVGFSKKLSANNLLPSGNPVSNLPGMDKMNLLTCTVTPTETLGPYPWASGTNINSSVFWRSNILESGTVGAGEGGIPLTFKLRIINVANCTPIPNARVDVWHCSEAGNYSGYGSYVGQTWMRGIQQTDSEGYVTFKTVFPGWYTGRIQHVHYQVFVGGVSKLVSQFTFPLDLMNQINGLSPYSITPGKPPYGPNPGFPGQSSILTYASDNIFSNGTAGQILNMSGDVNTGLYGTLDVVINYGAAAPASINNFNGGLHDGRAMLWWSAEPKPEFSHFLVEKSNDWEDFFPVETIKSKSLLGENQHYIFQEKEKLTVDTQYRLTMFDRDGNSESTVYLPFSMGKKALEITTEPANDHLILKHPEMKNAEASLVVVNREGQELLRGAMAFGANASLLDVSGLRAGDYFLVYDDASSLEVLPFSKR